MPPPAICCSSVRESCWRRTSIRTGWKLRGDPFPIAEQRDRERRCPHRPPGPSPIARLRPTAASGSSSGSIGPAGKLNKVVYPDTASLGPALSRDGRRVAVFRLWNGNMDIWSYDIGRRAWDRVTFDSGDDIFPLWSPDGSQHRVRLAGAANMNLYRKLLGGPPGSEELLLSTPQPKFPMDWSADGRFLLYDSLDPKRGSTSGRCRSKETESRSRSSRRTSTNVSAQFSPDGKWIAYQSDKTGRFEIYVRPFPGPGGDVRVSIDGGTQVRWNPNGKELFYVAADDRLMAVPIRFASNGKDCRSLARPCGCLRRTWAARPSTRTDSNTSCLRMASRS